MRKIMYITDSREIEFEKQVQHTHTDMHTHT